MLQEAAAYKKNWQIAQKTLRDNGEDCAFVYVHLEADSGNPFYVGIGIKNERPWQTCMRNKTHVGIVEKHGMRVEIVIDNISYKLAGWWERIWIRTLRNAGYRLANYADGGEGGSVSGEKNHFSKLTESQVIEILEATDSPAKMSKKFGISGSTVREIRKGDIWHNLYAKANKPEKYDDDRLKTGASHPRFGANQNEETRQLLRKINTGKTHSSATKQLCSEKSSGENNGMYGKKHTKKVIENNRQISLLQKSDPEYIAKHKAGIAARESSVAAVMRRIFLSWERSCRWNNKNLYWGA